MPAETPSAARGSVALLVSFFAIAVINYSFAILMSWLLPVDQYGLLGVLQSILLLGATMTSSAFPWALTRIFSQGHGTLAAAGAFRGALVGNSILGVAFAGGLYGCMLAGWITFGEQSELLMLLVGVTIAVLAVGAVFAAALQGLLRLEAVGAVRTLEVAVKFAASAGLVLSGLGTVGAVAGFLVGAAVATVLAGVLVGGPPRSGGGWGERSMYASAVPFFLSMSSLALLTNLDIIGLKLFSPADVSAQLAGYYQAAVTLARIPIFLTLALMNAVFPYVAQHTGKSEARDAYAGLAMKYALLFIMPASAVLMVIPDEIIRVFFSPAYDASAGPMALVSLGVIALSLAHGLAMLLQAGGRLRLTMVALPVGVAVQVVTLAWLVPAYGMAGAATSVGAAGALLMIILTPASLATFRVMPSARTSLAYVVALIALAAILRALPHEGRLMTTATIIVAGTGYVATLVVLGLLTGRDVRVLSGGLGTRWAGLAQRVAGAVDRLNLVPLAR